MAKGGREKKKPEKGSGGEAMVNLPPGRRGEPKLVGKRVVDTEGLELGYVEEVIGQELKVGEGPFSEWLRIPMSFVGEVGEEIQLMEPLQELLNDVEVFDSTGRNVGWVTDVIATGDVVDGIIVKSPNDSHFVLLENLRSIGGFITLDVSLEDLKEREGERKKKA